MFARAELLCSQMLILCTSKYIWLAICVHNSPHCILWSTNIKYIMHSIMYTRVQNAFWLVWSHLSRVQERPCVISNVNWQPITMCFCTWGRLAVYFSDLQWCCMVSHELGSYHKKIVCRIILGPGNWEKS